jgi:hypothetical protein
MTDAPAAWSRDPGAVADQLREFCRTMPADAAAEWRDRLRSDRRDGTLCPDANVWSFLTRALGPNITGEIAFLVLVDRGARETLTRAGLTPPSHDIGPIVNVRFIGSRGDWYVLIADRWYWWNGHEWRHVPLGAL